MSLPQPSLDTVTTFGNDGKRRFIHPSTAHGRFSRWRSLAGVLLLLIYAALPWIPINGQPAVFLDVVNRRFHLFGFTFVPQDLYLAFFLITGLGFSLFFITALLGRIWCGWACPQTVFLDIVRRIDRFFEGDGPTRAMLDSRPLQGTESLRRLLRQLSTGIFAVLIAHIFLSYFVSVPELWRMMHSAPSQHWSAFLLVAAISVALWFDFAWFREQFCIVLCPYGRLQSALTDTDSLVIGYDEKRGEPRGKKGTDGAGACVDCRRCVQVCPTGIDIRQGLQIECIGCAACVDACDTVMDKLKRPRGLVRYDSQNGLAGKKRRILRPRIFLYIILMLLGVTAASFAIRKYRPANISIIRMVGSPYFVEAEQVRNQFTLRVINKRHHEVRYRAEITGAPAALKTLGLENGIHLPAYVEKTMPLVLTLPREISRGQIPLTLRVLDEKGGLVVERPFPFLGP